MIGAKIDSIHKNQFYILINFFFRSFDCMRIGDMGVAVVKPEDGSGLPQNPGNAGTDADIDAGDDDIDDYDENVVRQIFS